MQADQLRGDEQRTDVHETEVDAMISALRNEMCTLKFGAQCVGGCNPDYTCTELLPACDSAATNASHPSQCFCVGQSCPNGVYWIDDGSNGARPYYVDMDGSITGIKYMMRWDTSWASTAYFQSGETCASSFPVMQTGGYVGVSAGKGGSYSSAHGGCGTAMTNPLGNFRATAIKITDVRIPGKCNDGSVDFPAGHFEVGSVEQTGGMSAYRQGNHHYVGNYAYCGSGACSNLAVNAYWVGTGATSWSVADKSDYQFALGTKSYGRCTGLEVGLKMWFVWDL